MYKYIRVHMGTYCSLPSFKKVQIGLEPAILCIPRTEFTPALWGYRPQCRWRWLGGNMLVYISSGSVKLLVSAPGGWWRIDVAGPAAPPPPAITSPARAWTRISWKPADRRSNQKETVTWQLPGFQYTALGNSKSTSNTLERSWVAWIHASLQADHWNWNCNCCHQYLWPWQQCHVSSESDCQASKQNYFGCSLNFQRRRREVLTTFVWAGSSFLKPSEHLKR
jgi:hypothetical protein